MNEQPEASPVARGRRREVLVASGCLAVVAAAAIAIATVSGPSSPASSPHDRGPVSSGASPDPSLLRQVALQHVMRQRSRAIVGHDRRAFARTLDPRSRRFRAAQLQMFANLSRLHFASWSYSFDASGGPPPPTARRRYRAPTFSPKDFTLRYRIAGFDPRPTELPQYPTFVERSGRWYLGSLTDFRARGDVSATGLWDYAPVHVVRRPGVLALGPASKLTTMIAAADEMRAAIPRVTAVWGRNWSRRVVVLVPATQHEMALIDSDAADLHQIAALTSAEISSAHGKPAPVGDRVTLNPANWSKVGPLGARIVLTHELTHVATRVDTGSQTPKWLSEGFADYVGFRGTGVPVSLAAAELATDVRTGHVARQLPANSAFRGSNNALSQAYEDGLLACRYLADHYGQAKLVRFYRVVGTSSLGRAAAVSHALQQVFGLTTAQFGRAWHDYVVGQLR